jgi:diguanylate cyclase
MPCILLQPLPAPPSCGQSITFPRCNFVTRAVYITHTCNELSESFNRSARGRRVLAKSNKNAHTLKYARFALEQIERFDLPADPRGFELWYIYATGHNPALNKAIDAAAASAEGLTEDEIDRLSGLHVSSRRSATRIGQISTDLSGEITQVMEMIETAMLSSQSYNNDLGKGLDDIERTTSQLMLKPIVEALITATKDMENAARGLELRLEESKSKTADLQKSVDTLRLETLTDPLTLVGNRQRFDDSLGSMTAAAQASGQPLSLLMADIDHFKKFNDWFGHQAGDQVLRLVATAIKGALRDSDVVARYGGEEFTVILPNAPMAFARMTAERVRQSIAARDVKKRTTGESLGQITISIGVAEFRHGESSVEFVERADACLYAAKRSGRNRVIGDRDPETASEKA